VAIDDVSLKEREREKERKRERKREREGERERERGRIISQQNWLPKGGKRRRERTSVGK
jgi:hypothetical protein